MKKLLPVLMLMSVLSAGAQPYIDLLHSGLLLSPSGTGSSSAGKNIRLQYFSVGATLPLQIGHSKDAVIASPVYEEWTMMGANTSKLRGMILPLSYLKTAKSGHWSLLATVIGRLNNQVPGPVSNASQLGGALIISSKKTEALSFKYGLYYNREFFGNFFMPLAGIDWHINANNNIFGVLPGSITYEHKHGGHFYWGAVFRAITNSYRLPAPDSCNSGCSLQQYLRIDDNQLAVYADYYITKHIVINLEAGHSLFRKIRLGTKTAATHPVNTVLSCRDAFFIKAAVAYRLRL